jgi:hypothetical protein
MSLDKSAKEFLGTGSIATHTGQAKDVDKTQERLAKAAAEEALRVAAEFTEEIIVWLNRRALERNLDPEQRIFAVSLATINLRQNFPESKGGKEFFDKVSNSAWAYYDANK